MLRDHLVKLNRRTKRVIQVAVDLLLIWLSLWLAFYLRLGSVQMIEPFSGHAWLFITAPAIAIPLFIRFGMYRAVMRYLGNDALIAIAKAVTLSTLLLSVVIYWYRDLPEIVPRSMIFNYWIVSLILIGGLRLALRQYFLGDWYRAITVPFIKQPDELPRVAIYGAGSAGNQLVAALRMGRAMRPVAFIDDDKSIANRIIAGLKVYTPKHIQQMIDETGAEEILLAIPSATRARRREVLGLLEPYPLHVRTVPRISDLACGKVQVDDLQEVDIADLLGRDPVTPRPELFARCITGQVVMVTGAGGSIGSELCRQIIGQKPRTLILLDHAEFNLYSIHRELDAHIQREALPVTLVPVLGSIRNAPLLLQVMRHWKVATLYHAAAYKHVPMVEHNIAEGFGNNVLGTLNAAQAAIQAGVTSFVLISTDKAVRPTNIMGSTKRLAEMILQALSREAAPVLHGQADDIHQVNRTRFTMVRFGNVLGSSGSVIPLFRTQIRKGGPVTVTHPKITRFFMTITEAAQLVIQAGAMGEGGDVFVLDMGEPVRIVELAEQMIKLSGLSVRSPANPHGDVAIEFTGLRPGEKLYEELLIGDDVSPTSHPKIMRASEDFLVWEAFRAALVELSRAIDAGDYLRVRQLLRDVVAGYSPEGDIVDWLHGKRSIE